MLHHGRVEAHGRPAEVIQRYWSKVLDETSIASIEHGVLRVVFQAGQMTLWFGDRVITKGFSGYTSVRSFTRWHESDKAKWTIESCTSTRFEATGRYWGLPAVQHWIVEIDAQGVLSWEVSMCIEEQLRFEREQASFMFCEEYDRLRAGTYAADIGDFKHAISDDWEVVYSVDAEQGPIDLVPSDPSLPTVRFRCSASDGTHVVRIVNSDANFRGRLVQALRKPGSEQKSPGTYSFFHGTLETRTPG
jgi:hypothetical protein